MDNIKNLWAKEGSITFLLCLALVTTLSIQSSIFWTTDNLNSLQAIIAPTAIVAFGMVLLLICGVFDLSVGAIMVFSGILCAKMFEMNLPVPVVILIGLLAGTLIGLFNGVLVGILKINSLIATIGTLNIFQGIAMILFAGSHKGQAEYQTAIKLPENFIWIGTGKFLGLYNMFWIMLALLILISLFQRYSPVGRQMYLAGDNPEAAKLMGFDTPRIIMLTFTFTGFLCAIAGILSVARFGQANRYLGEGINITTIISCLLGGASFAGGRGSAIGTIFGVICMCLFTNLFNLLEVTSTWQSVVVGSILIMVVSIDGYLILKKQRELGKI